MSRAFLCLLLLCFAPLISGAEEAKKDAPAAPAIFQPFTQPVGDFKLEERGGNYVRSRDLLGKIWVVQFFYPGCNLCSRNTPTMQRLQEMYRGKPDVCLVSIALNGDSIETLQEFAKDHDADPAQWLFLTGPEEKVHQIVISDFANFTFRLPNPQPGESIAHTMSLFVVDPQGSIVGYTDGTKDKAAEVLKEQIDRLRVRHRLEARIPVTGADLPWFNALLNASCTVLLLLGWTAIRLRWETLHKILMLLALAVSMIFLSSYLFYHFVVLGAESMRFRGEGTVRYVYFAILLSHTILAVIVAPLALFLTVQGLRDARQLHVRVARWTLPLWLYVSVTGVIVYWMLYRVEW